MALFSALDVSVRKKYNLHDFLCILHETEWPLVLQTSMEITIHQLILFSLALDRLIFPQLPLFGAGILEEKKQHVSHIQHTIENCSACVNVHNSRTISWIAAWRSMFGQ